ncbi:cytochrome c oxidase assembly protein [Terrihabitans rhizophilus]|uniref:Cytochrome c oxidase assembly protein n=1 Tax=Terrihabitans rhizophilus TaxID=3092662 RepID=A0ABU4RPE5_9HYPH|nr:cytochrome c oxidase assembly protein [Terrihabitans sp. PJ23]MDX6805515.1 cytochrome c oxidase assembly protein [Terrihabitans sp. PJ23]
MTGSQFDLLLAASRCFGGQTFGGWTLDPTLLAPLLLSAGLYGSGTLRLWRRAGWGRGVSGAQAALFALGWLATAIALVSPLHDASRRLFTAHMVEHELLMVVAAPLLVLGRPLGAMLWALRQAWRRGLGRAARGRRFVALWAFLTRPLTATVLHGLAIWIWHVKGLFEAALAVEWLHWLQHLSFFASALLFWWVMLEGWRRRHASGAVVGHLFVTSLHTGFLGVLLTFSPSLLYEAMPDAGLWGMTPLEDQQLAGLIMWIPAGMVYAVAALAMAASWLKTARQDRPVLYSPNVP